MDFVTHLPQFMRGHDAIWLIQVKLTKSAHILNVNLRMFMAKMIQLQIREIMKLYGVPSNIVPTRDPRSIFAKHYRTLWGAY